MKTLLAVLVIVLSASLGLAEAAQPSPVQAVGGMAKPSARLSDKQISIDRQFNLLNTDYKKPQVLAETFFNPFKVQADVGLSKKEGPGVTNESVAAAIGHRGVSGIVYLSGKGANQVIIGDQVFGIGDELSFPGGEKAGFVPLVAGATVVLREVGKDRLGVDVTGESDTARRVTFPLRSFWQP
jgi:hypothetical protein